MCYRASRYLSTSLLQLTSSQRPTFVNVIRTLFRDIALLGNCPRHGLTYWVSFLRRRAVRTALSLPISIIGAGLVGSLTACLLAQRGHAVAVYERGSDPRHVGYQGGRSINLALAYRGRRALALAGLEAQIVASGVPMVGRFVHPRGAEPFLMPYGLNGESILSVSRGDLNLRLLSAAEHAGAKLHFNQPLQGLRFADSGLDLEFAGQTLRTNGPVLGCDGAGSALRQALERQGLVQSRTDWLAHSYKELHIAPNADGTPKLRTDALHIWPREKFMCIALPNLDGSFTVTLFLANDSEQPAEPSFAALRSSGHYAPAKIEAFFDAFFPNLNALIPDLIEQFVANPDGALGTLYASPYAVRQQILLLGDAAHAIVPFHGQGMNAGFEDAACLIELMAKGVDFSAVASEFERQRRPNCEAIAAMALENYIEMRDLVDDAEFLRLKAFERALGSRYGQRFLSRYAQVTFTDIPYVNAKANGAKQYRFMQMNLSEFERVPPNWSHIDAAFNKERTA
jgi:kynurenine 3-monooxygenase